MKILFAFLFAINVAADKNGGVGCAACGIIGGWLEQYAVANNKNGKEAIEDFCRFLPTNFERICNLAIGILSGPVQD